VFIKYRNENMKKNFLDEIQTVDPNMAIALANQPFIQIQTYIKQYNDHVAATTGAIIPQIPGMPGNGMPMQGMGAQGFFPGQHP
jgi:hypothetical protein